MSLINKLSFPENKFDLYFLGYDSPKALSHGKWTSNRQGLIELTHNYGTEDDENFSVNNGNKEPHRGFGHTCISVDNIQAACQRIEDAGYKFQKKLSDGRMNSIAFVLDPDGYWVEIVGQKPVEETESVKETDVATYNMVWTRYLPLAWSTGLLELSLMANAAEPHHDPRQGYREVPQVLPGDSRHDAHPHSRDAQRRLQPVLPWVPRREGRSRGWVDASYGGTARAHMELRHREGRELQLP